MPVLDLGDLSLHYRDEGDAEGLPVVFAHALGTDLSLWDAVVARLPAGLRLIRYDLRGHGASSCPPGPYSMGALVRDAERLLDHLGLRDCLFVGVSLGGMIGQGLAVKRLDLVRALVLSNTAVKIGTAESWARRIEETKAKGLEGIVEGVLERWFPKRIRRGLDLSTLRAGFLSTPVEGYLGCCRAVAGTDFYTPTAGLRLPVLVVAGSEDGSTPPDLVRELAELIPGAEFHLIRGAGHLPMIDATAVFADRLADFAARLGPVSCDCGDPAHHGAEEHGHHGGHHHGGHDHGEACCGGADHHHDHDHDLHHAHAPKDAAAQPDAAQSHRHGPGCCGGH